MTNQEKEFWRQFAGSIVRQLMTVLGTFLAAHGYLSTEQSNGLTRAAVVEFVVSILLLFGARLWSWAKIKFNVGVVRQARASASDKPIDVITTETLNKENLISSV